jgi:DNA-nicking Smr family endonuclease
LIKKISDKDKNDWEKFIKKKEKLPNKDISLKKINREELIKKIDLHGYSLQNANETISNFINECFFKNVTKIIVITGKGLRSDNISNPYVSKDLSILKHSVPEYIKSNIDLMKKIIDIKDAKIEDGGGGAFYINLKNKYKKNN